ncbi:hypothetical protein ABT299_05975 [Spirillospora sp. NPDC000708]
MPTSPPGPHAGSTAAHALALPGGAVLDALCAERPGNGAARADVRPATVAQGVV